MPKTPITRAFFGIIEDKAIDFSLVKATLINVDGTLKELEPKNGKTFEYDEIRDIIGNIIEPLCLRHYAKQDRFKRMNFIVDEEGAINGQLYNPIASFVLRQILGPGTQNLYGPVIFLPNKLFRIY